MEEKDLCINTEECNVLPIIPTTRMRQRITVLALLMACFVSAPYGHGAHAQEPEQQNAAAVNNAFLPDYVDKIVVNYQAPCKPGTQANVTTWHSNGSDNRRAYDWRCHEGPINENDRYRVYAPHDGVVRIQRWGHPEYGVIYIEDTENNACATMFHLDYEKFTVSNGQAVKAGSPVGEYFAELKCAWHEPSKRTICAGRHMHLIVQDGLCSAIHHTIDQGRERPVQFKEFGQLLPSNIDLNGKKWVTVGECIGNVAPCVVPADNDVPTGNLSDVPLAHPFFPYIETLYFLEIVSGNSQGRYEPDRDLKRGEASKVIVMGIGAHREYNDGRCAFEDVCPGHVHYHTIRRLKELDITSADQPRFNPDEPLTRGGMAKYVVLALDRREPASSCAGDVLGVPCTNTFYKYVRRLKQIFDAKGVTLGTSQGQFNPDDPVKRGEAAKLTVIGLDLDDHLPKFYDVPHNSKFLRYINGIAGRGITQGCDSTSSYPKFCPEDLLTRGQAATFIVRGYGYTPFYSSGQSFPDVPRANTFYHHIEFLARHGMVSGFSDGTFRPDAPVTRGEIAKMITNTLVHRKLRCTVLDTATFRDVPQGHVFFEPIQCLAYLGVTHGYSDGEYKPDRHITRAEAAKFIYEAFITLSSSQQQESDDRANNSPQGASQLTQSKNLSLPHGDVDWLKFIVPDSAVMAAGVENSNAYLLKFATGLNVTLDLQVEDAGGAPVAYTLASELLSLDDLPEQPEHSIIVLDLPAGEYRIRTTNRAEFASEGVDFTATLSRLDRDLFRPTAPLGDVSCDSEANVIDASWILQYDVGLRQAANSCPLAPDTILLDACDVNGDSACDVRDALWLLQCSVGLSNSFCPAAAAVNVPSSASTTTPARLYLDHTGGQTTIMADLHGNTLGAATVEVQLDPAHHTITGCESDPDQRFSLGLCNPTYSEGVARFNVVAGDGVAGVLPLAQVTIAPTDADPTLRLRVVTFAGVDGAAIPTEGEDSEIDFRLLLPFVQR